MGRPGWKRGTGELSGGLPPLVYEIVLRENRPGSEDETGKLCRVVNREHKGLLKNDHRVR